MVKGLDIFRAWFEAYADQYILIGGTAASLAMEDAGLDFRATKDLDVVLHVEALTPAFGETFWKFIQAGGYEIRQANDTGKPAFYRFQKPTKQEFPVMVELFSRAPDSLRPIGDGDLTPIPFDEAVSSLSAILLDDVYYAFIMAGRREVNGLPWVGEDRLIPLKAIAWLDLSARKEQGEHIDAKNIRKHVNDVLRLSQLLAATTRIPLDPKIADDMRKFLEAAAADATLDPKTLAKWQREHVRKQSISLLTPTESVLPVCAFRRQAGPRRTVRSIGPSLSQAAVSCVAGQWFLSAMHFKTSNRLCLAS